LARGKADVFTRTRPEVIDGMRAALEHRQKIGEVYAAFTSAETTGGPRNEQVAHNLEQAVRRATQPVQHAIKNRADDIQALINGLDSDPFIQTIIMSQGRSPSVIAYFPEQVQDMRRFCSRDTPETYIVQ